MLYKRFRRGVGRLIRFHLKELLARREQALGRRVTLDEIAKETGIGRNTLSRIADPGGYNATTDTLDKLCNYFGCRLDELVEHISEKV